MIVLSFGEWKRLHPQDFAFGYRVRNRPVRCSSHSRKIAFRWKWSRHIDVDHKPWGEPLIAVAAKEFMKWEEIKKWMSPSEGTRNV